jgi:predicted  nucleic acid-binding Zn-ribbon protein
VSGSLIGVEIDGPCTSFWCMACDVEITEQRWNDVADTVFHARCEACGVAS